MPLRPSSTRGPCKERYGRVLNALTTRAVAATTATIWLDVLLPKSSASVFSGV